MEALKTALAGKKTYLTGGLLIALGIATALGYTEVNQDLVEGAKTALLGAVALALRAGVEKTAKP